MFGATVRLPATQRVSFPDHCVGCDTPNPNHVQERCVSAERAVEAVPNGDDVWQVPICRSCEATDQRNTRRLWIIATIQGAVIFAWVAASLSDRQFHSAKAMVWTFAAYWLPLMSVAFWVTRRFALPSVEIARGKVSCRFRFRNRAYARRFADSNPVSDSSVPTTVRSRCSSENKFPFCPQIWARFGRGGSVETGGVLVSTLRISAVSTRPKMAQSCEARMGSCSCAGTKVVRLDTSTVARCPDHCVRCDAPGASYPLRVGDGILADRDGVFALAGTSIARQDRSAASRQGLEFSLCAACGQRHDRARKRRRVLLLVALPAPFIVGFGWSYLRSHGWLSSGDPVAIAVAVAIIGLATAWSFRTVTPPFRVAYFGPHVQLWFESLAYAERFRRVNPSELPMLDGDPSAADHS